MAVIMNAFKCNCLTPLCFRGLNYVQWSVYGYALFCDLNCFDV